MSKIIPYGYLRVSSSEQARSGGGLDSQDEAVRAYIKERSAVFDVDHLVMMNDAGLSAYSGKHLSEGVLGQFLLDIEANKIPKNSALICFSIDRLSRQNPWVGTKFISTLIGAGIEIHSVAENQVLKSDDPVGAIMSTIYLMRANNESQIKSDRAKTGYLKRLDKSIRTNKVLTRQMPRWLFEENGLYAVDLRMKQAIDFIFDSYIAGQSSGYIASELNKKEWLYGSTQWRGSYVAKLIRDERLIGKHIRYSKQIKGVKREIIDSIPDFYPLVVDVEKFHLANKMLTNVAENIRGRTRITYGDTSILRNVFSNVIKCGMCGGDTSVVQNTRVKIVEGVKKYVPYKTFLRCRTKYELSECRQGDVRYEIIERVILMHLMNLDIPSLLAAPVDNKVELYKTELESCIADKIQYESIIESRKKEGKRIRPNTIDALEDTLDRIDELNRLIETHVEENFVPNFNVDLDSIADVSNVKDRSLVKKGIATIAEHVTYKRISDYIVIEIKYRNINVKHVLIVDNKESKVVVNFSINYEEVCNVYRCNDFIMSYEKLTRVFTIDTMNVEGYVHMMNFIDFVNDDVAVSAKEYLLSSMDNVDFSKLK
ncbi:recombinase family protein [Pseudescherichia vulneris]|uniref:recombinase family protein n=1 Tax=Pseudescherichia vulneris TaxID=566 RepID=UPI0028D43595|nr:recombinase family protein [Pseudescherichia vulneris]